MPGTIPMLCKYYPILTSQLHYEIGIIASFMIKLRHRKLKQCAQGHTVSR